MVSRSRCIILADKLRLFIILSLKSKAPKESKRDVSGHTRKLLVTAGEYNHICMFALGGCIYVRLYDDNDPRVLVDLSIHCKGGTQ